MNHACAILDEMIDGGTVPDISTFKVVIAGSAEIIKMLVREVVSNGFN